MPPRGADDEEASVTAPILRSLLFVPGDSERKQAKGLASPADALILDLEDSVAAQQRSAARIRVRELLQGHPDRSRQQLWVRTNALTSGLLLEDLVAVFPGAPDGIVLPKAVSPDELAELSNYLSALEAREGRAQGATKVIPIATETPQAVLTLGGYPQALGTNARVRARLVGLTWGCEDLSAAMGITHKTDRRGSLTFTFQLARSLCALAATALAIQAIDGVYVDFRDSEGLTRDVESARRDGFSGKLALHPDQIEPIHKALAPAPAEVEWATRVVAAFAASPQAGVMSLDGQMIDRPHLLQAQQILEVASRKT